MKIFTKAFILALLTSNLALAGNKASVVETKNANTYNCSVTVSTVLITPTRCNLSLGSVCAVANGTPPYTYLWAPSGATSDTVNNLSVGTYTVTVTDALSCSGSASVNVYQPTPPVISLVNDTVCGGICTASLTPTLMFGQPPYAYSWSNGSTNYIATGLCAGSYTATVMDANGCTCTASALVFSYGNIPSLSIIPAITNSTCFNINDGSIFVNASGPTSPYKYEWGNSYGSNSYNNLTSATYTLTLRDVNQSCNVFTYTVGYNDTCGNISGYTFNDTNFNCTFNFGDPRTNTSSITITPGNYVLYPNSIGYYNQEAPYGNYTVTQTFQPGSPFGICASSQPVTVNAVTPSVNFTDSTHAALSDPMVTYLYATPILVGDSCSAQFQVKNNGNDTSVGRAFFTIGDSLKLISTTPAYSSYSNDTIYWNYSQLLPGDTLNYSVNCVADTTPHIGFSYCYFAGLTSYKPESNSQNDILPYCVFFGVPCDPNGKRVSPPGQGPTGLIHSTDSVLTYIIQFQNIGSAIAQNIYITDTLSSHLDANTFQVLGSSNAFTYKITGSRIRFTFSHINLPDSMSNPNGSKGWIEYQIKQNKNNIPGDVINNTAYIYFDYNAAIVTNTATNTLEAPTAVIEIKTANNLIIYPNPASDNISVSYLLSQNSAVKLQVLDITGREVISQNIGRTLAGKQQTEIPVKSLATGSYILRLETDNSVMTRNFDIIR